MNVLIIGGFLGSGKTSLLLQLAGFLTGRSEAGKASLVIIENEVGETSIDDKILKAEGLQVRELFSGCICCTLTTDLTVALQEIHEKYSPEWVIIEATGMAYPHKIMETLSTYGKGIAGISSLVVVDAERWEELSAVVTGLVEGQIAKADFVLLNKIDCLEPLQVDEIEENVRGLNPGARFFQVSAHNGVDPQIWREVVGKNG